MKKLAFTHPGKIGDALYSLPTVRKMCMDWGVTCDFYTSEYCAPIKRLFEYQDCIDSVIIADWYKVERMDMGCQPWLIPVPNAEQYSRVYHLGFRRVPNQSIHQFIWKEINGYDFPLSVEYQVPKKRVYSGDTQLYYCIAPRGETSYKDLFNEFIKESPFTCLIIGGSGDYTGYGVDFTGLDFLETCSLLQYSEGFFGLMSSQLVLANGFKTPKVAPHNGVSWDMRHVIRGPLNHYPINPTADTIIELL